MRSIIYLLLAVIGISFYAAGEEAGNISGMIIRESRNQHDGTRVILRDANGVKIKEGSTIFNGEFLFEGVSNGEYELEIYGDAGAPKRFNIRKDKRNDSLDKIVLGRDETFAIYSMSNIISGFVIILNCMFLCFMIRKREVANKIEIFLSVGSSTFWFVMEFSRFILGFFNEAEASYLWAVSNIGTAYVGFFTMFFFLKYPADYNLGRKAKAAIFSIYTLMTVSVFVWLYWGLTYKELLFKGWVFNLIFLTANLIFLVTAAIFLVRNIIKRRGTYKAELSKPFIKTIVTLSAIVVAIIVVLKFTGIKEPFDGYYKVVFAGLNIILYWNMLKYGFSFKYIKGGSVIAYAYVEAFKYLLVISGLFVYITYFEEDNRGTAAFYALAGMFLKIAVDFYWHIKKSREEMAYRKIAARLEGLRNRNEIKSVVDTNIKNLFKIEASDIIMMENENEPFFKKIEKSEGNVIEEGEFCGKERGFKIAYENRLIGVLSIKSASEKFGIKEMDFYINLAQELGEAVNRIAVNEAKERREEAIGAREKGRAPKELAFIKGFSEAVIRKSDNTEVKEMAETIRRLSEGLVEEWEKK